MFTIPNYGSASFVQQSEPDKVDFDILAAGLNGTGVGAGCAVTATNSAVSRFVSVAAGTVRFSSGTLVNVPAVTLTPTTPNAVNPRFDLVVVAPSGNAILLTGTAAVVPVIPSLPAGFVALATVFFPSAATWITNGNIVDKRVIIPALFEIEVPFDHPGVVGVSVGVQAWVARWTGLIVGISVQAEAAPTGQSIIVDVNKNATGTIYTNQANRPFLNAGATIGAETVPNTPTFVAGDYFTVDLEQVGSTFAGSGVRVVLRVLKT